MTRREDAPAEARRQEFIRPYYEVEGDEHAYEVRVFLPGVPREQANITLEKDTLTVEASRVPHAAEGWRPQHREIATADYRLRLQLNLRVDEANIAASSQDGVLTIKLPVAEEAKPRSIAIN
ncbi:MAG: Hsp20/alpha crystallin family protein [Opitutales bacterium]